MPQHQFETGSESDRTYIRNPVGEFTKVTTSILRDSSALATGDRNMISCVPAPASQISSVQPILQMQRRYGNRYVQRMLGLSRQSDGSGAGEVTPDVESAIERARSGGLSLDSRTRGQMESAFGADFSGVRIHTDAESHSLNRSVNAVAFTTGRDIFFRDGAYNPDASGGRELLAHELTHVVQQGAAQQVSGQAQRVAVQRMCSECEKEKKNHVQAKLVVGEANDQYEQEADQVAQTVMNTLNTDAARTAEMVSGRVLATTGGKLAAMQRQFNPFPKQTLEKSISETKEYLSEKDVEQRLLAFLLRSRAFLHSQKKDTRIPQEIRDQIAKLFTQLLVADPYVETLKRGEMPSDDPEIVARHLAKLCPKVHTGNLEFLDKEMRPPELTIVEKTIVEKTIVEKTKRAVSETDVPASPYEVPPKTSTGRLTDEELFKQATGKDIGSKILPVGRIAQVVKSVVDQFSKPKALTHRECSVPKSADGELDWIAFEEDLQLLPAPEKVQLEQAKTAYEITDTDSIRKDKRVFFLWEEMYEKKHKKAEKSSLQRKIYGKYDNSLEVAYRLADLLQHACEKNESSVKLVLKDAYNQIPQEEKSPIFRALKTILGHIKRLLRKTTEGMAVQVFFGKQQVETINLRDIPVGQPRPMSAEELRQKEKDEQAAAAKQN